MATYVYNLSYNKSIVSNLGKGLDGIRDAVREVMRSLAKLLNRLSNGRLTPDTITIIGLLAHIPIAYLIGKQQFALAAVFLVIFGLFDSLDGELARLQKRASSSGMLLDASTDRMKEVILYSGVAYSLIANSQAYWAVWAVAACGGSLLVSYVKAKGETAVTGQRLTANEINRLFQDGLLRFEVRMAVLVVGLLANQLALAIVVIAILSWYTAWWRLLSIRKKLIKQ